MRYFYGDKTPLRVLDEIEFWKRQETEHTIVIRQVAKDLERDFVEKLKNWELAFSKTEGVAVRNIEEVIRCKGVITPILCENIRSFTIFAFNQSLSFVVFLNQLVAESEAVSNNEIAVAVINHIRRESEYFIGIVKAALQCF